MSKEKEKKYILAHDHGTSGSKAAIISMTGDVLGFEFEDVPLFLPSSGAAEQKPEDWWKAMKITINKLIDQNLVPVDDIVGFCNSSQWSGTVPVDKDGNNLMNCIIWMDSRGAPYMKKFNKGLLKVTGYNVRKILKFIKYTGGGPTLLGKDPPAHILFIKDQFPDIYDKTYKFLEVQDYINLKVTGKFAASKASIQVHWITDSRDINNIDYHPGLIKMIKFNREQFPELKESIDVLGTLTKEASDELGLNKDVKVIMGAPDLHTAAIGSGAVRDYEGHIYIGTSSWCVAHIPFKKTDLFHNMGTIPSAIPGRYLIANEQEIAGGCLSFFKDNVLYHKDDLLKEEAVPNIYKIFDKIVEQTPAGSNKLIFTPWLYGERAPVDDHTLRGGFYNVSLEMTRGHLIRSIFEGVAFNSRWIVKYVEKMMKKPFEALNLIGGGANSNVWCQIYADILNRPIKQVENPIEANARGAAFIGAVGLGYMTFDDIPKYIKYSNIFQPNQENRKIYDMLFKEFVNIYKNNHKMYKRLNKYD